MKVHLRLKRRLRSALLLIPLCGALYSNAQQYNIAPAATTAAPNSGQAGDGTGSNGPCWAINDGYVGVFPGTAFAGTIAPGGNLEYTWSERQTFNRIKIYNAAAAMAGCTIEYDNGSGYQTLTTYANSSNAPEDSITFPAVTALKLRFTNVRAGGKGQAASLREIQVLHTPASGNACPGTLTAGTITPGEQTLCLGADATLIAGGYSFADAIAYQWQVNSSGSWSDIAGATNTWYRFRVTTATPADAQYRLKVTCAATTVYTAVPVRIRVAGGHDAVYASLPYFEDFEKPWTNGCGTGDIAGSSWTTSPTSGPHIWKALSAYGGKETKIPAPPNGKDCARFGSSFKTATNYLGHMDLHVNCSAPAGEKLLYFYYVNESDPRGESYPAGNDVLTVSMSKDGGQTFEPLSAFTTQDAWGLKTVPILSDAAKTIIRFSGRTQTAVGARDQSDLAVDSVYLVGPCSGSVLAGTVTPSSVNICPGTETTLSATGASQGGGIVYQWEQSANGTSGWANVTGGSGATTPILQTPVLFSPMHYRLKVTCVNGNSSQTTAAVKVNLESPVYASIPFTETFEQWTKRCDTINEIPSKNWVNTPATGMSSWRRNDDANDAWGFSTVWAPGNIYVFDDWHASRGKYEPAAFEGDHSARFHTVGNIGKIGKLDLFIDCSKQTGDKELSFALNLTKDIPATGNNPNPAPNGYDYLNVYLSTDGGQNFTLLEKFQGPGFSKWEIKSLSFTSVSATTVLRFEAVSISGYKDMGLDYVRVLPACNGNPVAGTIDSISPCLDTDFFLKLSGSTQGGGITYQWQRATSAAGPWINMPGTNSNVYRTQIQAPTWFRAVVTCPGAEKSDTSAVRLVQPAPFYYCYCESGFNSEVTLNNNFSAVHFGKNIGNVTIVTPSGKDTLLKNGDYKNHYSYPSPDFRPYSDFRTTVAPARLYLDSAYKFIIHSIHSSTVGSKPIKWTAYIDYNQDGVYDTLTERIWIDRNKNTDERPTQGSGVPWDTYSFEVPSAAKVGLTGMRVILMGGGGTLIQHWNMGPVPCGVYGDGETEDYLVSIERYPCTEAPEAGTTVISDTLMCAGYDLELINTTHGSGLPTISWDWQYSTNGSTWSTIVNSEGKDTLSYTFTEPSSFRLRVICGNSKDTAYSNVVQAGQKEAYQCYCYNIATGNALDTSDVGQFKIGAYLFGGPGAHLNNATAVNGRTEYTDTTLVFYADSTYDVSLSHILRGSNHADAKVTLFIDYNNNLEYDADELVWTGFTTASIWNPATSIKIPSDVVTEVKTGMRLILNNDLEDNDPSDEGCGPYFSGETEDYVVLFHKDSKVGITPMQTAIRDLKLYPNPTGGKVSLQYFGAAQQKVQVTLVNISGQVLKVKDAASVKNGSILEMDLDEFAQGMYFIRFDAGGEYIIRKLTLMKH